MGREDAVEFEPAGIVDCGLVVVTEPPVEPVILLLMSGDLLDMPGCVELVGIFPIPEALFTPAPMPGCTEVFGAVWVGVDVVGGIDVGDFRAEVFPVILASVPDDAVPVPGVAGLETPLVVVAVSVVGLPVAPAPVFVLL